MTISYVFSNFFSNKCFSKEAKVKINSAASTGIQGEYKNVGFPWLPMVSAHDPKSLHEHRTPA
jgi:hypothetical protein